MRLFFVLATIFSITNNLPLDAYIHVGKDPSIYVNTGEGVKKQSFFERFAETPRFDILSKIDFLLELTTTTRLRTYELITPYRIENYHPNIPELEEISKEYGFFSEHPIVATVTDDISDLQLSCNAVKSLYDNANLQLIRLSGEEILCKIIAYRSLKEGMAFNIPAVVNNKVVLIRYIVDKKFNLWHGMPAFGLIPVQKGMPAVLLFRGTNFNITSIDGAASIISDLDIDGPGHSVYERSKPMLHDWLQNTKNKGYSIRVMGFSLGGALAIYTYVDEYPLLSPEGSVAFNPPGFKDETIKKWDELPPAWKNGLTIYVTQGDVIPKVGKLFGNVYALSTGKTYTPLQSHTLFVTGHQKFEKAVVDVAKDNAIGR